MTALLLVDIQNDFLPGGALPVPEGDQILPIVNSLLEQSFDLVIATKDWHPKGHGSFAATHKKKVGEKITLNGLEQILWPNHCVQQSTGAEFPSGLKSNNIDKIILKGIDPLIDSYSAFFDNGHRKETGLADFLKTKGVSDLYVAGLATDYCVKYTVLDAIREGFNVFIIADACRGVNLSPEDSKNALEEMRRQGAVIIESKSLLG